MVVGDVEIVAAGFEIEIVVENLPPAPDVNRLGEDPPSPPAATTSTPPAELPANVEFPPAAPLEAPPAPIVTAHPVVLVKVTKVSITSPPHPPSQKNYS